MMKKTGFSLVLLVFLILPPTASSGPLRASLVPPEARWVIHIDVARLAETKVKALFYEDSGSEIGRAVRLMERVGKIDLLRDMSGVTIVGLGPDDKDAVVAFEGKIDKDYLLALIELDKSPQKIPYGQFTLYKWGSHEYGVFVTDKLTLIGGNDRTIRAVLDTWEGKGKSAAETPLLAKFKSASPGAFLVASTPNLSALTKDDEGPAFLKKAGAAVLQVEEVKGILKLNLVLDTDSAETASNLAKIVDGLIAMESLGRGRSSRRTNLLTDLKISREGNVLQATLEMPAEDLSRRLRRSLSGLPDFFEP
jgi:hypothetical protein